MKQIPPATSPIDVLADSTWDVLIIGGGIVGAGVARDAAMRGLRTALVEQCDFASGTSSRSTRLLHGGIRYLAQGRIGLVREANREKTILHRIAPHLAEPLAFIFPSRSGIGLSRWKLSLGVKLYDWLCGRRNLGRSSTLGPAETLNAVPGYSSEGLTGAVRYFDAFTNDSRLVIDTLRSASLHRATVTNYVRYVDAQRGDGQWLCQLVDERSSATMTVRTKSLVNAAGPWSDRIPGAQTSLRLTKGVHLVIDRSRLPVPDAVVSVEGDRILFAIPWGERVILGTTDTDYEGPLDRPTCDPEDEQYVLDAINKDFPSAKLTTGDVISTWAGLRPLVADRHGNPSDISRRHQITMSQPGWWDVTGGKLTTYRLMAEETVDSIVQYLNAESRACQTAQSPLLLEQVERHRCGVLPPEVSRELVQHFCRNEWACRLDDVMIRRTSWRYYHRNHLDIALQIAQWMKAELGWSDQILQAELRRYRQITSPIGFGPPYFLSRETNCDSSNLHASDARAQRARAPAADGEID